MATANGADARASDLPAQWRGGWIEKDAEWLHGRRQCRVRSLSTYSPNWGIPISKHSYHNASTMTQTETKQDNENRASGFAIVLWSTLALFAIATLFLVFVQSVTGMFSPLSKWGGTVSQWCQPGSSKRIESPVFSSDGSKFVLTMRGTCKIGVYTINTESMVYLAPPKDSAAFGATFDPKSTTIAFILARQVGPEAIDYQLAVSQIDGSGLRVLTSSDTQKRFPAYSFDGKKIAFEGKERCRNSPGKYCGADIYEYDFLSNTEKRMSYLQAGQMGPAHFLPGNNKFVTPIYGKIYPDGVTAVPVEKEHGKEHEVFIFDAHKPTNYEQLALDTPTASHARPLPSGEIAFISRVNEYENVKGGYLYDVFLWSNGASRRLTKSNRFIWDYAISDSAHSVLLVAEAKANEFNCELILWNVTEQARRNLKCDGLASELPLTP